MRSLEFVPPAENAFVDAVAKALGAGRRVQLQESGPLAIQVTRRLRAQIADIVIEPSASAADPAPVVALCETDGEKLTAALMEQMDRPSVHVIAPVTDWTWNRRSLFLISIPKSGTHLLMELAAAFGYRSGEEAPPEAVPGAWHYLEFTNSHTAAPDFFIDTVRRAPHGNRAHSFPRTPSLFIYRNPLDIVASEANYYQEDGATVFAGYLDALSYEERLLRLIDDPWLMGSIRDRVGKFAAWLEFGSAIPVSFEELVGPQGGGDAAVQANLIWSLMLRLHVPGRPADIAARVFNPNSPTFRFGKIGGHQKRFNEAAWQKFNALPQDFMQVYGFAQRPASGPWLPGRAEEFRRRAPRYSKVDMGATPFLVRQNYLGHNILRYRGRFWAMPHGFPFGDLMKAPPEAFKMMLSAEDPATLEFLVQSKLILNYNRNTA
jgi:hypothetical protein